jgi:hypothetical protein
LHSIEAIEIDDHILDKIESKHGVSFEEAEEACISDGKHIRRGREGLYKVLTGYLDDIYWWCWQTRAMVYIKLLQPEK